MAETFFWYDLETSGISPRDARIMQFAGQRTDMNLQPVGEPVNVLVKLSEDVLPDPDAIMITGITPQSTLQDGLSEAEFLQFFHAEVATPGTIFVGYNTVRFDDEFMRFLHYRNFYDAYEWGYKDGKSRWDLLDVVRMTRALRPEGITWPMTEDGKPTNRLELLTKLNGLDHEHAHDALNDVLATIAVAELIKSKQPKLFVWLLTHRDKRAVADFLGSNQTFIYSSGKYANETEKTSVVRLLRPEQGGNKPALVYDLRHDPTEFIDMTPEQLAERMRYTKEPDAPARLPVQQLKYNRCPAISPTGLLSDAGVQKRLQVTPELVSANLSKLNATPQFVANMITACELADTERQAEWNKGPVDADNALYDGGFFDDTDKRGMQAVRTSSVKQLAELELDFHDTRLQTLLPRYKARNFPGSLSDDERATWERYRYDALLGGGTESRMAKFARRLSELAETDAGKEQSFLLEELQLYAGSIMPVTDTDQ